MDGETGEAGGALQGVTRPANVARWLLPRAVDVAMPCRRPRMRA